MAFDCMDDCIHLHACRRVQAIGKSLRLNVPRYCTEDCNCYLSGKDNLYVTVDEAISYARDGVSAIRSGYDGYDVYAGFELPGRTLNDLIEEMED